MADSTARHTWITCLALRISASSGLPLAPPKAAPCVLDLLGRARPQSHLAVKSAIWLGLRGLALGERRDRLDPAAAVGPLQRFGRVEQELVPSPGRLQLQGNRQPFGGADRDADGGDAG